MKYEIIKEDFKITWFGVKVFRIRYIKTKELGGYIEKESNLSQEGNAKVSGNAEVWGNAEVSGNAEVWGDAKVSGNAEVWGDDYIAISPIGSRRASVTFTKDKNGNLFVTTGCFSGSIEEFEKAVKKEHGDNEHGKNYQLAIALAKAKLKK